MTVAVQTTTPPVTPTTPATGTQTDLISGQSSLNSSYSTFLTLLTTQLKNQDPTAPLDTNQFTQQLVSLTGVQQQLLGNQLLQKIADASGGGAGVAGAVGLIGKTVTAASASATLSGGRASWSYTLAAPATTGQLSIADSTGKVVWSGTPPELSAGAHAFTWNGQDASGRQLPDGGSYTLKVAGADATGGGVNAAVSIQGAVTAVSQANGQTLVTVGQTPTPLSTVTAVTGA